MLKKIKKFIEKNWQYIVVIISLLIVILLLEDVLEHEIMKGDIIATNIFSSLQKDSVTTIMKLITSLGSASIIIPLTVIIIYLIKNKRISLCISLNLVMVTVLNTILKVIIQRPRPEGFGIIKETGYSFPSGHSMVSMAFYGYLIYLIYKYVKDKKKKYLLSGILLTLILLVGISRMYLGVHYLTDVIAGFLTSIVYLILFINLTKGYIKGEKNEK